MAGARNKDEKVAKPKRPTGRPQGSGGSRATVYEFNERVRMCMRMVASLLHNHQIATVIVDKYGVSTRQAKAYISRAKRRLIKRSKKSKEVHIAEINGLYEDTIRNPDATLADKLAVQRDRRKMLGLDAPMTIAQTDSKGQDIEREQAAAMDEVIKSLTNEELAVIRKFNNLVKVKMSAPSEPAKS